MKYLPRSGLWHYSPWRFINDRQSEGISILPILATGDVKNNNPAPGGTKTAETHNPVLNQVQLKSYPCILLITTQITYVRIIVIKSVQG